MRKKLVAGNWKMNKNLHEAILLADDVRKAVESLDKAKLPLVVLAPPFPFLYPVAQTLTGNGSIFTGAQNCYPERSGAFTGEVSVDMIRSTGARYVIVGHSERRSLFSEGDEFLRKKTLAVLEGDLCPILCMGEQLEERNSGKHFERIEQQLKGTLFTLPPESIAKLVLAYEPVWAIGTGLTATTAQAQEMHAFIRKRVAEYAGKERAEELLILYGGSCNAANAKELFSCPDLDGGLIGGASLKANDFVAIIKAAM
jgi:triosephosphate isomerase